jgi:hypothetical protein
MKVFLGGTCAGRNWRDELIPHLQVDYFNPVVSDWTKEAEENEYLEKQSSGIHLYVITSGLKGVFSIAEVMDSALTPGKISILHVVPDGFDMKMLRSLEATVNLLKARGSIAYIDNDLLRSARLINDMCI